MATCLDYAKIAYAAYFTAPSQYYETPPGHAVDDWVVQRWAEGGFFGDGFQGGIWQSDTDVIVGCCGTNPNQKGKLVKDLLADVRIGLNIMPNQASSARKMIDLARSLANGRRISVTGHSLGGGLAQVLGVWEDVPFVTFNAPAMAHTLKAAKVNFFKPQVMQRTRGVVDGTTPGVNFRIRGLGLDGVVRNDPVSMHGALGGHLGMVVDLPAQSSTGAHGKNTCWQAVLATDWSNIDPF
jgi:hypothetical protein